MDLDRGERAVLTPTIISVAETGSTNADLLALAAAGSASDGLWMVAERQTAGRGRQGRGWTSPTGNLHASTLVRLGPGDPPAATLALAAAVALARALASLGVEARIKWPNDLMLDGAKLAGILLERAGDWVVIGCGVNIVFAPAVPGRATAALVEHVPGVTAAAVLARLVDELAIAVGTWRGRGLTAIAAEWMVHAHALGTRLSVSLPDGATLSGNFDGLAPDGALNLRLADGGRRAIHAGDVFLV